MNKNSKINVASLMTLIFAAFSAPHCVFADQVKTVMTSVSGIGSLAQNTSARPVKAAGVEMVVIGKG